MACSRVSFTFTFIKNLYVLTNVSETLEQEVPQTSLRKELLCSKQKERYEKVNCRFCNGTAKCACKSHLRNSVLSVADFTSPNDKSVIQHPMHEGRNEVQCNLTLAPFSIESLWKFGASPSLKMSKMSVFRILWQLSCGKVPCGCISQTVIQILQSHRNLRRVYGFTLTSSCLSQTVLQPTQLKLYWRVN